MNKSLILNLFRVYSNILVSIQTIEAVLQTKPAKESQGDKEKFLKKAKMV